MPLADDDEKWLSARELGRALSAALDEVQFDGRTIKISRYGRLAATLIPPPTAGVEAPPRAQDTGTAAVDIELTDLQGRIVDAIARWPHRWWQPQVSLAGGDVVTLLREIARLELSGLMTRDSIGYWLTPAGRRLARARGAPNE